MKIAIEYDGDMHDGTDVRKDILGMLSADLDDRPKPSEPFSVYVSGPSSDLPRARKVVEALRERGVHVIGDGWIGDVEANGPDAALPRSVLAEGAEADLGAIRDATMLLALTTEWGTGASGGVSIEAGAALGLERPVVTSGGPLHALFRTAVLAEFWGGAPDYANHDAEAVAFVAAYAAGWSAARGLPLDRYRLGRPAPYGDEPPKVEPDAAALAEVEEPALPGKPKPVVRPGDLLAKLGTSPEVLAAREAGRAALSTPEDDL